jgi:1,4-alpha-glucan branching enzyme
MSSGYLSILLHAHLPHVRHPDDPTVMEHRWFQEAVTETYLPLLAMFDGLEADRVPFRCTLSLSAPLIDMLDDTLLRERYEAHLEQMVELAQRELERTADEPHYHRVARMYDRRLRHMREMWRSCGGQLLPRFRHLQEIGGLEIITSTATHAFFPLMDRNWEAMRAQVQVAADQYERHFGRRTPGMWLGECGYVPGTDLLLEEAAVRYFIVDGHALLHADPAPVYGVYAPVFCPSGVAAFARDPETSEQVWSAESGYPGDPHYRDFYRDIGFDLPREVIGPYIHPEGHRVATGFKYHAITHDQLHDKWVYDPERARSLAGDHARDFRTRCEELCARVGGGMDRPPMILSPYDAELYGHWWFEGPVFLEYLFRQLHFDQDRITPITPGEYLDRHPTNQVVTPGASSWGESGYNAYWLNESNAWIYPHLHRAAERMTELARRAVDPSDLERRALNQAARELMLAQSSDWAFIMRTGTTVPYAERRTRDHVLRFNRIFEDLSAAQVDEAWLRQIEDEDDLFPHIDYRVFAP